MKQEEIDTIAGNEESRGREVLHRILDIPLDDCSEENFRAVTDKLNKLCAIEDNGNVIMKIARDSAMYSTAKNSTRPNSMQIVHMNVQFIVTYGFILGYYYRSGEMRREKA